LNFRFLILFQAFILTSLSLASVNPNNPKSYTFVPNLGQWHQEVKYRMDFDFSTLFFEKNALHYQIVNAPSHINHEHDEDGKIEGHTFRIEFLASNPDAKLEAESPSSYYYNYYLGKDRSRWQTGVKAYEKLSYRDIYPNIDLNYYRKENQLKYDFVIKPKADPSIIRFEVKGADKVSIKKDELHIKYHFGEMVEQKPYAYQIVNGKEKAVECRFVELSDNVIGFEILGEYDNSLDLIIDPVVVFSTYSGSTSTNFGMTATYDGAGNGYMGGTVFGNAYNNTSLGYQPNYAGGSADITISKFSRDGSRLLFSTFLGGNESEAVNSMVVNSRQELIILSVTSSFNYPVTIGAYQPIKVISQRSNLSRYLQDYVSGNDIAISQFSPNGRQLLSSTFFGGNSSDGLNCNLNNLNSVNIGLVFNYGDHFRGEITVGPNDTVYVGTSTHSSDLDSTISGFGGVQDGIIAKFSPNLRTLYWSRYLGGSSFDAIYSLKITDRNEILVGGGTMSFSDFPSLPGAHQPHSNGGRSEGFVSLLNTKGDLLHSTFLGSDLYDQIYFVESDRDNNFYALGQTQSILFPNFGTSIANVGAGQFIVEFDSTLSQLEFSHTFGNINTGASNINISPTAFLVDRCKNIYVSGWGGSLSNTNDGLKTMRNNMPLSANASDPNTDGNDFYLYVVNNDLDSIIYASFLGGGLSQDHVDGGTSRFSKNGIIFQSICASCGAGSDFPTTPGSAFPLKGAGSGICNNALYKYDFEILPIASFTTDTSSFCLGVGDSVSVMITDQSLRANRVFWDINGTVVPGGFQDTTIVISNPGVYNITQIVEDTICATDAFASQTIIAYPDNIELNAKADTLICYSDSLVLDANDNGNANTFTWSSDPFFNNILAITDSSRYKVGLQAGIDTFYVRAGNSITLACEKIDTLVVEYIPVSFQSSLSEDTICENNDIQVTASVSNVDLHIWDLDNGFRDSSNLTINQTYNTPGSYNLQFIIRNNACVTNDTTNLPLEVVANDIVINSIPDTLICRADSVRLFQTGTGSISHYLWSTDSLFSDTLNNFPSDNELFVNQAGIDTFYVKLSNDYCFQTDAVEVEIVPFELELDPLPDSVCTPYSQALSTTIVNADSFRIFLGNGQSTSTVQNPTVTFNNEGLFDVELLGYNNRCNIADTITETIRVFNGVVLQALMDTVICLGDNAQLSILHNQTASQFIWSQFSNFSSPLNNPNDSVITVAPTDSTIYYYRAIDGICDADSSVEVGVNEVEIDLLDFNSICLNDTITIQANMLSGIPPFNYTWIPTADIIAGQGSNTISIAPKSDTRYYLTVTDDLACEDTASSLIEVNVPRFTTAEIFSNVDTIYKGQSVQLSQSRQEGNLTFRWEPAGYLNDPFSRSPIGTPPQSTTFFLTITDQQTGCELVVSKRIGVFEINCANPNIYVPTAFTPDGSGTNDILFVRGEVMREIDFSVYNRWGELIFRTQDQNKGWDGTIGGNPADPGVFVYHLKAICFDGQEYFEKGNVTLLR